MALFQSIASHSKGFLSGSRCYYCKRRYNFTDDVRNSLRRPIPTLTPPPMNFTTDLHNLEK